MAGEDYFCKTLDELEGQFCATVTKNPQPLCEEDMPTGPRGDAVGHEDDCIVLTSDPKPMHTHGTTREQVVS